MLNSPAQAMPDSPTHFAVRYFGDMPLPIAGQNDALPRPNT
jgi:hypothetical protein